MKKKTGLVVTVILILALCFSGCGAKDNQGQNPDGKKLPVIGIVQISEHASLDTIRNNLIAQLGDEGYVDKKTVTIDYQNAQNEPSNLKTICQKFSSKKYDLIIAIATPSAQAAFGETADIPIIFSAVTDPVAAELVDSLEVPGGNITGTSDAVSAEKIMGLALEITPDIKTIGALYNSNEANSLSVIADLKKFAKKNGLKVIEGPVTNTSEVQQSAAFLAGKADAVFSPIDNAIASSMPIVVDTLNKAKIPFYVGADSMVNDGGLATYGINYETLGKETGKMAALVLNGADPGTIPVKRLKDVQVYVNENTAKAIGVTFPEDVLSRATVLPEAK